jgi:hypothetical protein
LRSLLNLLSLLLPRRPIPPPCLPVDLLILLFLTLLRRRVVFIRFSQFRIRSNEVRFATEDLNNLDDDSHEIPFGSTLEEDVEAFGDEGGREGGVL